MEAYANVGSRPEADICCVAITHCVLTLSWGRRNFSLPESHPGVDNNRFTTLSAFVVAGKRLSALKQPRSDSFLVN